jgi:hypothetical protein
MRHKLTPAFVQKARADSGKDRTIFWDTAIPGFGLMVTAGGHRSYVVQYRAAGTSRRIHFKGVIKLDAARREAKKLIGTVAQGRDPLVERRNAAASATNTLKAIATEYFDREGGNIRTMAGRRATLERLVFPQLGARQIGSIRRTNVVRLLDRIEDEKGPAMADQVLAYLRRLFTWHAGRSDDFRSRSCAGWPAQSPPSGAGSAF